MAQPQIISVIAKGVVEGMKNTFSQRQGCLISLSHGSRKLPLVDSTFMNAQRRLEEQAKLRQMRSEKKRAQVRQRQSEEEITTNCTQLHLCRAMLDCQMHIGGVFVASEGAALNSNRFMGQCQLVAPGGDRCHVYNVLKGSKHSKDSCAEWRKTKTCISWNEWQRFIRSAVPDNDPLRKSDTRKSVRQENKAVDETPTRSKGLCTTLNRTTAMKRAAEIKQHKDDFSQYKEANADLISSSKYQKAVYRGGRGYYRGYVYAEYIKVSVCKSSIPPPRASSSRVKVASNSTLGEAVGQQATPQGRASAKSSTQESLKMNSSEYNFWRSYDSRIGRRTAEQRQRVQQYHSWLSHLIEAERLKRGMVRSGDDYLNLKCEVRKIVLNSRTVLLSSKLKMEKDQHEEESKVRKETRKMAKKKAKKKAPTKPEAGMLRESGADANVARRPKAKGKTRGVPRDRRMARKTKQTKREEKKQTKREEKSRGEALAGGIRYRNKDTVDRVYRRIVHEAIEDSYKEESRILAAMVL